MGVAPLKIKIGSLSGATWNFFLIQLGEKSGERGKGGDDSYRFSTFMEEERAMLRKLPMPLNGAREFDSLVRSGQQSAYLSLSVLMAQRMTTRPRRFLSPCAINASLTIALASNNRNFRLVRDVRMLLRRRRRAHRQHVKTHNGVVYGNLLHWRWCRYLVTAVQNSRARGE